MTGNEKKLYDALMVILGTPMLSQHLRFNDPMAYTQAIEAVLQAKDGVVCTYCGRDLEDKQELVTGLCTSDDCPRHDE